jgi:hypothetical protein
MKNSIGKTDTPNELNGSMFHAKDKSGQLPDSIIDAKTDVGGVQGIYKNNVIVPSLGLTELDDLLVTWLKVLIFIRQATATRVPMILT